MTEVRGESPESPPPGGPTSRQSPAIPYAVPPPRREATTFLFWTSFYFLGLFVGVAAVLALQASTPAASVAQVAATAWAVALVLHLRGHRLRFAAAVVAVLMVWLPVLYVVVWTSSQILRMLAQNRELFDPDHPVGLPEFLFVELVVLIPLTVPLWIFAQFKPWRDRSVR